MVKKFIKGNDSLLWTGAVIGVVVLFLYVGGVREGFQNAPSVQTALPSMIPSGTSDNMPSATAVPPMNTTNFTPPAPVVQNAKPSIATLRTKLNELKTMVDNM